MFFNIGGAEILVIAVIALIAVGPEQLPGVLRKVGRTMGQVRSMAAGLRDEFMAGADELGSTVDPGTWFDGSGSSNDPVVRRGFADADDGDAPENGSSTAEQTGNGTASGSPDDPPPLAAGSVDGAPPAADPPAVEGPDLTGAPSDVAVGADQTDGVRPEPSGAEGDPA